jgi:hypothetical protein
MSGKKLLVDMQGSIRMTLTEGTDGKMMARGEFGRADVPTENGRIYPRKVWEKQIEMIRQPMAEGKVQGHLNHPSDGKTDLTKVSHVMKNIWMEDDGRILGEARICDNEFGKQLMSILDAGGAVGVSSRGMGSTRQDHASGKEIVEDDYSYITHDFVSDPAVKTSYPKITVEEKQIIKPVVESAVKQEKTMDVLTEEVVAKRINEATEAQKKTFENNLVEKMALLRESVEKEVRAEVMSDPKVVGAKLTVDQMVTALKPFIMKEDVDGEIAKRDQTIKDLQLQLEAKTKELQEMESSAKEIVENAKRIGMALFVERTLAKEQDRADLTEMLGDLKQFKTEAQLTEAIKKQKEKISEKKKKALKEKEMKESIEAKHQKEIKALKEENDKKNRALVESLRKEKTLAAQLYLEDRVKGNPNARLIKKLAEGISDKRKIDDLVSTHSIASSSTSLYNNVNERLSRLDNVKRAGNLVEEQLAKADGTDKPNKTFTKDVDAEIAELGGMI